MNAKSRARAAAVPTSRLNLRSKNGLAEFKRRMARRARDWGNAWHHQTERPVGKVKLRNVPGLKQRWAWVPHTANKEGKP